MCHPGLWPGAGGIDVPPNIPSKDAMPDASIPWREEATRTIVPMITYPLVTSTVVPNSPSRAAMPDASIPWREEATYTIVPMITYPLITSTAPIMYHNCSTQQPQYRRHARRLYSLAGGGNVYDSADDNLSFGYIDCIHYVLKQSVRDDCFQGHISCLDCY